jgi:hypothetical protein
MPGGRPLTSTLFPEARARTARIARGSGADAAGQLTPGPAGSRTWGRAAAQPVGLAAGGGAGARLRGHVCLLRPNEFYGYTRLQDRGGGHIHQPASPAGSPVASRPPLRRPPALAAPNRSPWPSRASTSPGPARPARRCTSPRHAGPRPGTASRSGPVSPSHCRTRKYVTFGEIPGDGIGSTRGVRDGPLPFRRLPKGDARQLDA